VVPAWKLARGGALHNSLQDVGRGSSGGLQRSRAHSLLVVLEVALACVLTISAGLAVRSFINLLQINLGFEPHDLIAVRIDPAVEGTQVPYLERILDRTRTLPGVAHAAMTDCVPVERDRSWGLYPVIPDNPNDQRWTGAHVRIVSPELFPAMGTTLVAGRDFTRMDGKDQSKVIIVNQSLAKRFWPGEDPVGRQVMVGGRVRFTVIGVAADVRHHGPEVPSGDEMYLPYTQAEDAQSWDMLVRTKLPVAAFAAGLRNMLRDVDPTLPLTKVRAMTTLVERTTSSHRLLISLIGGFAAIAVGLAALGLYGLLSYLVTQQTKEIGIRMALGANASTVRRQIVGKTMKLTLGGLLLGLGGAVAASRLLQSLLYGVSATDPMTYGVMTFTLLVCALVAGYLPARRASRIDPIIALRAE
jgi:predicted permease